MAGQISSFAKGSDLVIKIGDVNIAFCQSLSFSRNVTNIPIMSIGSYGPSALEPVDFSASGSLQITRYSTAILTPKDTKVFNRTALELPAVLPPKVRGAVLDTKFRDGNSLVSSIDFNPQLMLISQTFDIAVYERQLGTDLEMNNTAKLMYTLKDCRATSYSFSFAPGQLLVENFSFVCRNVIDAAV